jgi:Fe-S oxidoreductase
LAAGMPQQRVIPAFAPQTFKAWFRKRAVRHPDKPKVVLWPDTFNNYFFPETAQAAVEVLEAAGYQVTVPRQHLCCGRPLYDYGFLPLAKSYLEHVLHALSAEIEADTPMVVLEPSCCSVFRDELKGMLPHSAAAHKLMEQTFTLAEFMEKKATHYQPPKLKRQAIVQGHCHQKAIMRLQEEKQVMQKMGLDFQVLESGCCGMAGSFGYEKEKYEVSIACGERVLLPEVRKAGLSTIVMADGFSCKEQIEQQTSRHALHLAEVIQMAMRSGVEENYPEATIVGPRLLGQKRSMVRAAIVTGTVLAGVAIMILGASLAR